VIKQITRYIFFLLTAMIVFACAREMAPQGGKKDVIPPKIVQAEPPNGSPRFSGDKFSLKFNEFVVLNKINEQLLISPPVKEVPDFHLKGKTLTVKLASVSNTTWNNWVNEMYALPTITSSLPYYAAALIINSHWWQVIKYIMPITQQWEIKSLHVE